jgi:hypothetical protein
MLKTSLLATALLALTVTGVSAQPSRGTKQQQDTCAGDARRHCKKVLGEGDMAVLQCLQQNRRRLSSRCRRTLEENGQ